MKYEDMVKKVFARGTVPNGYFGETVKVGFALIGRRVVTVAPCGYFSTGLPDVLDEREALWIINHHPSARHIKGVKPVGGASAVRRS